jgi:pimeloyl-ACP methyl ester carboxylesterase
MDRSSVLFIPGMMLDGRMYASQISALAPAHRSMVADISGSNSIEGLARGALAAAPRRFALVGLSLGGIVALEIHRQARERISHVALLGTTPYADRPERRAARLAQLAAVERGELAQVLKTSMKPLYLADRNRANQELLEAILQMGIALGPTAFRNQSHALMHRSDYRGMLASIDCPAMVLCGREDQLCPVAIHIELADAMPRADLVVLSETGHLSSMEEPAAVTAALCRLLQRS